MQNSDMVLNFIEKKQTDLRRIILSGDIYMIIVYVLNFAYALAVLYTTGPVLVDGWPHNVMYVLNYGLLIIEIVLIAFNIVLVCKINSFFTRKIQVQECPTGMCKNQGQEKCFVCTKTLGMLSQLRRTFRRSFICI